MTKLHRVASFTLVLAVAAGIGRASAQATTGPGIDDATRHPAAPLLEQYCFRCHGAQTQTAGVNLDGLIAQRPLVRNREAWTRAIDAVEVGKMPPAGATQPSDAERETLHALLSDSIDNFDYSTVDDPGYEPAKRLTHASSTTRCATSSARTSPSPTASPPSWPAPAASTTPPTRCSSNRR